MQRVTHIGGHPDAAGTPQTEHAKEGLCIVVILFHAYVGTGQTVNFREGLEVSYQDALSLAGEQSNTAALGALKTLGPPPYSPDELRNLGRWLVKLGGGIYGETTVWPIFKPIILAPGYSLIDIHKYKDGSSQAMTRVLGAIMNEDLHELGYDFEIPIFSSWAGTITTPRRLSQKITSTPSKHLSKN